MTSLWDERNADIPRIRRALTKIFTRRARAKALAAGISASEFAEWVQEVVGEGIAVALSEISDWEPEKGDFLKAEGVSS